MIAAIARAPNTADTSNLTFKWTTSQIRRQRGASGSQPGAAQMALHNVEVRMAWGNGNGTEACIRIIGNLKDSLAELQNNIAHDQSDLVRTNLATGQNIAKEWCVGWTNEELGQAVHAPMHRGLTHSAHIGMQPLAERFGAKTVPVETGVAIIGCAPAIADAVLQGWPQHEARIHLPRRISTYRTHCEHEADARLSSPSAGHDLTWIIATGGQVHPATVAAALFDVLGEFPTTESICALNPGAHAFENMIQVTVPAHLRQRMHMGPAGRGWLDPHRRKESQGLPVHRSEEAGTP